MMMNLNGKTAIVTGGAVRLGREIAVALSRQGMNVAVHYGRSAEAAGQTVRDIAAVGGTAVAIQADLSQPSEAASTIVEKTVAEFGRLDVLINNAAIFEPGDLRSTTDDQWDRHWAINVQAPLCLCREFVQALETGQRGHIINMADWRATRPVPGHLAYTLSKSTLVALTKVLAQELAPDVQVNAVAPGAILPPPGEDASFLQQLAETIPLRRTGRPVDITDAVVYLLRADFITGEVLHVAGGQQL